MLNRRLWRLEIAIIERTKPLSLGLYQIKEANKGRVTEVKLEVCCETVSANKERTL